MILLVSFGSDQLSWYRFDLPFVHWFIPLLSVVFCSRLCSAFKINILHRYPFKAAFFHQIIGLSLYFFCGHHRILQGILTSDSVAWIPLKESFTFDFHMCSALVCTSFLKVIKSVHGIIPFVFGYLFASGMVELCFEPAIYLKGLLYDFCYSVFCLWSFDPLRIPVLSKSFPFYLFTLQTVDLCIISIEFSDRFPAFLPDASSNSDAEEKVFRFFCHWNQSFLS